jgi:hypothetical protein
MSKKQENAAIEKWYGSDRKTQIAKTKDAINSKLITYGEWVKAVLITNQNTHENEKRAAIELLNTLLPKIHAQIDKSPENGKAFVEHMLGYYIGEYDEDDVDLFYGSSEAGKLSKERDTNLNE